MRDSARYSWSLDQLMRQLGSDRGHLVEQFTGQKYRRLGHAKAYVGANAGIEIVQETLIGFRAEARIEILTQGRNHANRVYPA